MINVANRSLHHSWIDVSGTEKVGPQDARPFSCPFL
jgi:hypothetical protein